jgi:hypothetical protein
VSLSLGEPPPSLAGFPVSPPPPALVRVCRRANTTWWFSSDGSGRFDLGPPEGTCYLATDAFAAIREASRAGPVTPGWVADRDLCHVTAPDLKARLASVTRAKAATYDLTTELVTATPYDLPRRWAAAFRGAGFGGIRHELRHDPRAKPSGVSLFGAAGDPGWLPAKRESITRANVEAARVRVMDIPPSAALTILPRGQRLSHKPPPDQDY